MARSASSVASPAFLFVMTTGIVHLFDDITYEGGGSINGPFMASLGASAVIVSVTAGLGEFLGYALRLPAGYAADCTGALVAMVVARVNFPLPSRLEQGHTAPAKDFGRAYWLYMLAGALFAAGFMSFELISYHLTKARIASEQWIPVMLAISTAFGVLANLAFGKAYDRIGLPVVIAAVCASARSRPSCFSAASGLCCSGCCSGASATRHRTHCSRRSSPRCCRRESAISRSGCTTLATASAGLQAASLKACCTKTRESR